MATTKVTFTLDDVTLSRLSDAAERLAKPKSEVVREAIQNYHERIGYLSNAERLRLLAAFDQLLPKIPKRPKSDTQAELKELRRARRHGGRSRVY